MTRILAVLGPTAAGKTDLTIELARQLGAEVISVDSMQVYRGMDVGTAKPTVLERRGVAHHLIDVVDPEEEFSVAEFRIQGRAVIDTSNSPLVVSGGSGLHFRALVDPMEFAPTDSRLRASLEEMSPDEVREELLVRDPNAGSLVDMANPRRLVRAYEILLLTGETPTERAQSAKAGNVRRYKSEIEFTAIGIDPGEDLEARIDQRLHWMREGGLVEEVAGLRDRLGRTAASAVGYREVLAYLRGECDEGEAFAAISRNTKKLARKQRTWFQRDPRVRWVPWIGDKEELARRALAELD